MSLKHYLNKASFYKRRKTETTIKYVWRIVRTIIALYPAARKYGLRYYINHAYRMTCSFRAARIRQDAMRRKKQGRHFRKNRWLIKRQLIERDGQICICCKQGFEWEELTFDHIIRLKDGGSSELDNLQLLCEVCHTAKTKRENANSS